MPNLVAQVKRALSDSDTVLVSDLYDAKFCTPAETVSLLHFDDTDNPLKDECGNIWKALNSDTLSITSDNAKFGKALFINGTLGISRNGGITLGGKDFTIDGWHYLTKTAEQFTSFFIFYNFNSSSNTYTDRIYLIRAYNISSGYQLGVEVGNGPSIYPNFSVPSFYNNFVHFAVVYEHQNSVIKVYANGILKASASITIPATKYEFAFVGPGSLNSPKLYGTIDEFRVVDGQALWTKNFTPPTEPYKLVDGHIPVKIKGSTQKLWMPFNFIKTDLTVADSDTT